MLNKIRLVAVLSGASVATKASQNILLTQVSATIGLYDAEMLNQEI